MEGASKLMKLATLLCMVVLCKAIESPQYAVVHEESDFEVRLYSQSTWMSACVREELSFAKATLLGFHRYPTSYLVYFEFNFKCYYHWRSILSQFSQL